MSASTPAASATTQGLPSWRGYLAALITIPAAALLTMVPHQFLWGSGFANGWLDRQLFTAPIPLPKVALLLLMLASLALHEVIHGVGYTLFGRVSWNQVEFGARWTHLLVYARCHAPLSRSALLKALLLPAVVLGMVPAAVGLAFGLGWLTWYGFMLLVFATGDFCTLWRMWRERALRCGEG
ncbi:DUF3267 domain-containing protein [Archangium sp.]|uniref:DUF3267 domain-containing protein n=1 Tax=Archangium sp. TaxID=1872627 RepID=UPI002D621491|nr:DUF3267 domain-containing protein [Archangium sp.]HYO51404.1 DUF3267 domain-containing protein [Archangium sp.]